jgi:hypothetical protein
MQHMHTPHHWFAKVCPGVPCLAWQLVVKQLTVAGCVASDPAPWLMPPVPCACELRMAWSCAWSARQVLLGYGNSRDAF